MDLPSRSSHDKITCPLKSIRNILEVIYDFYSNASLSCGGRGLPDNETEVHLPRS